MTVPTHAGPDDRGCLQGPLPGGGGGGEERSAVPSPPHGSRRGEGLGRHGAALAGRLPPAARAAGGPTSPADRPAAQPSGQQGDHGGGEAGDGCVVGGGGGGWGGDGAVVLLSRGLVVRLICYLYLTPRFSWPSG